MRPIAVLDLMGGQVVHARRGERGAYRPVESSLVAGAEPLKLAAALLALFPFDTLYIADLDAILGRGGHAVALASLRSRFPGVDLWLDAGHASAQALESCRSSGFTPVLGSESQRDSSLLEAARAADAVLSLDFREGVPLGPAQIAQRPELWPRRVIALDLARVGSGLGPDLELLAAVRRRAPDTQIYSGGGVRDAADLEALAAAGAAGVLLASALHDGRLTGADLTKTNRA
jgi:phosphoribosylformimino-5-aminoimidazole carboxamide ribotide isomerase